MWCCYWAGAEAFFLVHIGLSLGGTANILGGPGEKPIVACGWAGATCIPSGGIVGVIVGPGLPVTLRGCICY